VFVNGVVTTLLYLLAALAGTNDADIGTTIAMGLLGAWFVATIVPGMALFVRRLHDASLSGWMALLGFIPLAGGTITLVFALMGPKPEGQRFDRPGMDVGAGS
jgi:uncharacterized membrane protein YhaH (DUF805 family)